LLAGLVRPKGDFCSIPQFALASPKDDPFPAVEPTPFGRRQDTEVALTDNQGSKSVCDDYVRNLKKEATRVITRHFSTLYVNPWACTVTKVSQQKKPWELRMTERFNGHPHFMRYVVVPVLRSALRVR
jgi:hypothetical protein